MKLFFSSSSIQQLITGTLLIFSVSQAQAATFTFKDLGTLGGADSSAFAINDLGQVVGVSQLASGAYHAALWSNGPAVDLGTLGGSSSQANGINNAGQIVGYSDTRDGIPHATIWQGASKAAVDSGTATSHAYAINNSGKLVGDRVGGGFGAQLATSWSAGVGTNLGTLGGSHSFAYGLNDKGDVVGEAFTADTSAHATLWSAGKVMDLGTLGGSYSSALAINSIGSIVGFSNADGDVSQRATLWDKGLVHDLGTLGGADSGAYAINDNGDIVGYSQTSTGISHATVWTAGSITDLNSFLDVSLQRQGWILTVANAINANGWIVGDAYNTRSGLTHAFLLSSPVPEAESYAMMLSGLALLGLLRRGRKQG